MPEDEVVLSSTTSSPEQLAYTMSEEWRDGVTFDQWKAKQPPKEEASGAETPAKGEPGAAPPEPEEKPKRVGGWQKRVDALTRRQAEQDAEIERLRAELAASKTPSGEKKTDAPVSLSGKPKPTSDQFTTIDEFYDAREKWEREEARLGAEKQATDAHTAEVFTDYNAGVAAIQSKHPDFAEVVGNKEIQIPKAAQVAVIEEGERGAEIAYYLGKHPEVAKELCELSETNAVKMIGRIAARLFPDEKQPEKKTPAARVLPAPITPPAQRGAAPPASLAEVATSGTLAEWKRLRRAGAVN